MPVAGTGPAVEAKNGIRASIKSLFPDRDCATLVRPMHEEEVSMSLLGRQGRRLCALACTQLSRQPHCLQRNIRGFSAGPLGSAWAL